MARNNPVPPTLLGSSPHLAACVRALATVALVQAAACHRAAPSQGSPSASTSASAASAVAPSGGCAALDVLSPFQKYGSSDLIRSIAVDGGDVFFRTMDQTYRQPLAGGSASILGKSLGDMGGPSWVIGDRLVSQPTGQPALMAIPKAGGSWTPLADATSDKHGGAGAVPTILGNVRRGSVEAAQRAVFDGSHFYWIEEDIAGVRMGSPGSSTWSVRRVAATGGAAETLYKSQLDLDELLKAGDRLLFVQADQPKKPAAAAKPAAHGAKPSIQLPEARTWSLLSLPAGGGTPEVRAKPFPAPWIGAAIASDGSFVYYGSTNGLAFGLYRVSAAGSSPPELVDPHVISVHWGSSYGSDRVVLFVSGTAGAGVHDVEHFVLTAPRGSNHFDRTACIDSSYTEHAYAVADHTLLVSAYKTSENVAGIVRFSLP